MAQNIDADIAAFIAKNGVKKVCQSVRTYSGRDMYSMVRGEKTENDLINERHVTYSTSGREFVTNGLGERI